MKTFSDRLYDGLKPLYADLMKNCGSYCDEYTTATGINVVSFVAQWGKLFPIEANSGILFVGRATRGWANDDRNVDNLFDHPKDKIFNREDQMIWAHDYQSPFWRVLRGIANNIYGKDGTEHVAWTTVRNLAQGSYNGNPIGNL